MMVFIAIAACFILGMLAGWVLGRRDLESELEGIDSPPDESK
jgi:uncharacterized protein YneF (UPF0154 family)